MPVHCVFLIKVQVRQWCCCSMIFGPLGFIGSACKISFRLFCIKPSPFPPIKNAAVIKMCNVTPLKKAQKRHPAALM